jgi:hypothetical protein
MEQDSVEVVSEWVKVAAGARSDVERERVVVTSKDLLERPDCVLEGDKPAIETGEDLGNLVRLRHETLDFTGTLNL